MLSDEEAHFESDLRFETFPTRIFPIQFKKYEPLDLTILSEKGFFYIMLTIALTKTLS